MTGSFSYFERGGGGHKKFPPFKRRDAQSLTLSLGGGGGGQKVSDLRFSHFVAPRLPVINDQSLTIVKQCIDLGTESWYAKNSSMQKISMYLIEKSGQNEFLFTR